MVMEADHYPEGDRFEGQPMGKRISDEEIARLANLLIDLVAGSEVSPLKVNEVRGDEAIVDVYRTIQWFLLHVRDHS